MLRGFIVINEGVSLKKITPTRLKKVQLFIVFKNDF